MKRKKPIVTGTLQQKADRYYLVFRIPDSSGKLKQKMDQHRSARQGKSAPREAAAR